MKTKNELRTLKDLEGEDEYTEDKVHTGFWVSRAELKAEAVKWGRFAERYGNFRDAWLDFFNLTEEDLK